MRYLQWRSSHLHNFTRPFHWFNTHTSKKKKTINLRKRKKKIQIHFTQWITPAKAKENQPKKISKIIIKKKINQNPKSPWLSPTNTKRLSALSPPTLALPIHLQSPPIDHQLRGMDSRYRFTKNNRPICERDSRYSRERKGFAREAGDGRRHQLTTTAVAREEGGSLPPIWVWIGFWGES